MCSIRRENWNRKQPFLWEDKSLNLEKARSVRPYLQLRAHHNLTSENSLSDNYEVQLSPTQNMTTANLSLLVCRQSNKEKLQKKSKIALFSTRGPLESCNRLTIDHPSHPLLQDKAPEAHGVQYF